MSRDENDEALNLAIKASLEEEIINPIIEENDEDEQLKKAIEASLIENQNQNDELLNSVLYESLDNDILSTDETILAKVIEESNLSNISVRLNTEIINNGMSNNIDSIINMSNTSNTNDMSNTSDTSDTESDFINPSYNKYTNDDELDDTDATDSSNNNYDNDYDEEEYMKMIIHQIKESEELENKVKIRKQIKSIIEEQDFEYEEALRKDIEKEKEKDKFKTTNIDELVKKSDILSNKNIEEPELPKPNEELRRLRLAFFDKK